MPKTTVLVKEYGGIEQALVDLLELLPFQGYEIGRVEDDREAVRVPLSCCASLLRGGESRCFGLGVPDEQRANEGQLGSLAR